MIDAIFSGLAPIAEWTLLASAKATVIVGLVLLSQKLFNRWLSARGRYALWFAVVVCLAVPFNFESRWSVFGPNALYSALKSPASTPAMDAPRAIAPHSSSPLVTYSSGFVAEPPNDLKSKTEIGVPSALGPSHGVPWYVALWVVVGIGLTGLTFYNQIRYLRLRTAARQVDERARTLFKRCREDMGLHRHVRLLETPAVTSPSVFGCVAPTLLLPEGLQHELSERGLRHVFLHELAHIKRHDLFLNWLTMVLQILHWFNPVIWFSFSRMRSDREQACDAYVLERLPKVEWRDYGNTLIKLTDSLPVSMSLAHGAGIVESQKRMKARLQMIARFKLLTMRHALVPALLLALLATIALTTPSAQEHTHEASTVEKVVGVGPTWKILKSEAGSSYSGTVSHHMMKDAYPKVLSWSDLGDTFVFMFAFDSDDQRVPEEFHDMLPKPWTEIESRVKRGESLELTGEARGLRIVLLATPTRHELGNLIRSTALLDSVRDPSHADPITQSVVGVGPAWEILKSEVGSSYCGTVSHHMMKDAYPKVLSWSDLGDTFVFMFAFDSDDQRVPKEYQDMLPKPWTEIESRVKQGETLELTGEARGLHIVLLAAPTRRDLEGLIRSTSLLDEVRHAASGNDTARGHHTSHGSHSSATRPNVFVMSPYSLRLIQNVWSVLGDSVFNKSGRNHTTKNYDGIWDGTFNRSPNDLMVLLFTLDTAERIPEKYSYLLPRPWEEIEDTLRKGKSIELDGQARGVQVILLAAPDPSKLKRSVIESKLLHAYRAAYQKSQAPAIDIVVASDAVKLKPYDEGGLYSAIVAIQNAGSKESPSFGVHFVLTRGENKKTKTMTHGAGPIWPGDHWNEMSMPFSLEEGINDIAVIVDPDDAVYESDETNNRATLRVVVKGGRIVETAEPR